MSVFYFFNVSQSLVYYIRFSCFSEKNVNTMRIDRFDLLCWNTGLI